MDAGTIMISPRKRFTVSVIKKITNFFLVYSDQFCQWKNGFIPLYFSSINWQGLPGKCRGHSFLCPYEKGMG